MKRFVFIACFLISPAIAQSIPDLEKAVKVCTEPPPFGKRIPFPASSNKWQPGYEGCQAVMEKWAPIANQRANEARDRQDREAREFIDKMGK